MCGTVHFSEPYCGDCGQAQAGGEDQMLTGRCALAYTTAKREWGGRKESVPTIQLCFVGAPSGRQLDHLHESQGLQLKTGTVWNASFQS